MNEDPGEYDIDYEAAASRNMLEKRVPAELNKIKLSNRRYRQGPELRPWRLALTVDLVDAIERNCNQLLETMNNYRLLAAAWIARNLLELLVWVRFCSVSRENAWRFHEDALGDAKGLTDAHAKSCGAMRNVDRANASARTRRAFLAVRR
jgi:hypothetical protein